MKLELFNKIDATCDLLKENRELYDSLRKEIKFSLLDCLNDKDYVLSISSRIKTCDSLKEKLIRNRFYLKYDEPKEIINHLSDLIGLKIDCRFMDDEKLVYSTLKERFSILKDDGFYGHEKYPNIFLELDTKQPQTQRNGYNIYRVDGYYLNNDSKINFELQIKCLVNSFWGDIEHKLVYKNTNYNVFDEFTKSLLHTVKSNLTIIDRQLHILFNQMDSNNQVIDDYEDRLSLELMISKSINDLFTVKLKDDIGFSINLKETSNIMAHYLMQKDFKNITDEQDGALSLIKLFKTIEDNECKFSETVEFEETFKSEDIFEETLGNYLIERINVDFSWHVFFVILFSIEPGNNSEDFKLFLQVYKGYFVDEKYENSFGKLKAGDASKIQSQLLKMLANSLIEIGTIKIITDNNLDKIKTTFNTYVESLEKRVIDYKDFMHFAGNYYENLSKEINEIIK